MDSRYSSPANWSQFLADDSVAVLTPLTPAPDEPSRSKPVIVLALTDDVAAHLRTSPPSTEQLWTGWTGYASHPRTISTASNIYPYQDFPITPPPEGRRRASENCGSSRDSYFPSVSRSGSLVEYDPSTTALPVPRSLKRGAEGPATPSRAKRGRPAPLDISTLITPPSVPRANFDTVRRPNLSAGVGPEPSSLAHNYFNNGQPGSPCSGPVPGLQHSDYMSPQSTTMTLSPSGTPSVEGGRYLSGTTEGTHFEPVLEGQPWFVPSLSKSPYVPSFTLPRRVQEEEEDRHLSWSTSSSSLSGYPSSYPVSAPAWQTTFNVPGYFHPEEQYASQRYPPSSPLYYLTSLDQPPPPSSILGNLNGRPRSTPSTPEEATLETQERGNSLELTSPVVRRKGSLPALNLTSLSLYPPYPPPLRRFSHGSNLLASSPVTTRPSLNAGGGFSFINFSATDSKVLLSGVAPSGSSKGLKVGKRGREEGGTQRKRRVVSL